MSRIDKVTGYAAVVTIVLLILRNSGVVQVPDIAVIAPLAMVFVAYGVIGATEAARKGRW